MGEPLKFAERLIADIDAIMAKHTNQGKNLIILLGDKERKLLGAWVEGGSFGVQMFHWENGIVEFYGRKVVFCAVDSYRKFVTDVYK